MSHNNIDLVRSLPRSAQEDKSHLLLSLHGPESHYTQSQAVVARQMLQISEFNIHYPLRDLFSLYQMSHDPVSNSLVMCNNMDDTESLLETRNHGNEKAMVHYIFSLVHAGQIMPLTFFTLPAFEEMFDFVIQDTCKHIQRFNKRDVLSAIMLRGGVIAIGASQFPELRKYSEVATLSISTINCKQAGDASFHFGAKTQRKPKALVLVDEVFDTGFSASKSIYNMIKLDELSDIEYIHLCIAFVKCGRMKDIFVGEVNGQKYYTGNFPLSGTVLQRIYRTLATCMIADSVANDSELAERVASSFNKMPECVLGIAGQEILEEYDVKAQQMMKDRGIEINLSTAGNMIDAAKLHLPYNTQLAHWINIPHESALFKSKNFMGDISRSTKHLGDCNYIFVMLGAYDSETKKQTYLSYRDIVHQSSHAEEQDNNIASAKALGIEIPVYDNIKDSSTQCIFFDFEHNAESNEVVCKTAAKQVVKMQSIDPNKKNVVVVYQDNIPTEMFNEMIKQIKETCSEDLKLDIHYVHECKDTEESEKGYQYYHMLPIASLAKSVSARAFIEANNQTK